MMKAHFFDTNRFYLGTMELRNDFGDYFRVPILSKMESPLVFDEAPPRIRFMQHRNFKVLRVYEG